MAHGTMALALSCGSAATPAQQVPDAAFVPAVARPAYAVDRGPTVCVDEGHHNFHRLGARFRAFGDLLRADGFGVQPSTGSATAAVLNVCRIFVIANAQPSDAPWEAYPYPTPSAFTEDEVRALEAWVSGGGSLLLIADHMPFPGAAAAVAAAFGFAFNDGFAVADFRTEAEGRAAFERPTLFVLQDGTLRDHAVTRGRSGSDAVTQIRSFIGQAFKIPAGAKPLMVLPEGFVSLMPTRPWQFTLQTPKIGVSGWSQGATLELGRGRLAVFGEAGMFTAQLNGPDQRPMGMNAPHAQHNAQFVLNLMRWLANVGDSKP